MPLPDPAPGLVLRYAYLWFDQHRRGQEEGSKDRPCVIVLSACQEDGDTLVTVAPITHTPPRVIGEAVEIPPATRQRLGLDDGRSWVVVSEVNRFRWPCFDLRPAPATPAGKYHHGFLPPSLFTQVKSGILAWARSEQLRTTSR